MTVKQLLSILKKADPNWTVGLSLPYFGATTDKLSGEVWKENNMVILTGDVKEVIEMGEKFAEKLHTIDKR